ncbi:MAG TPA: hypothetical protein VNB94_03820 [Mycobacteriales bacterium]|nr:hypothetical protein [Mycobacteriales bacterium]
MDREALAALLLVDLDAIIDKTRAAYFERMPRLQRLPVEAVDDVIEATHLAMRQFLRYYVEGTLDGPSWRAVRESTIDRAGELFSRAEILDIVNIARSTASDAAHHLAELHPELAGSDRREIVKAMDRYVTELAEEEDRLRHHVTADRIDSALAALEADGADLA